MTMGFDTVPDGCRSHGPTVYLVCGSLLWHARHRKWAFSRIANSADKSTALSTPACQTTGPFDIAAFHAVQMLLTSCLGAAGAEKNEKETADRLNTPWEVRGLNRRR